MNNRARRLLLLALLACLALPASALASAQIQHLSFGPNSTGPTLIQQGFLSADGKCTAFLSSDKLLATDANNREDIYERCGADLTLVSTGPNQANDPVASPFLSFKQIAANGCVLFSTNEKLTDDDGDSRIDLYKRCGGAIDRVSQGPNGGNADQDVAQGNISDDGVCVAFTAHEKLTVDDGDTIPDWFERCGTTTKRITQGDDPGNDPNGYANFDGMTPDGSCVEFSTAEKLSSDDSDDQLDAYVRCGSTTKKVSPGNGAFDVSANGLSDDGTCAEIETDEKLAASDTDSQNDIYVVCGTNVRHVSAGGNTDQYVNSSDVSTDLDCVAFESSEELTADDTDTSADVYKRCGDTLERVSKGPGSDNAEIDATEEWMSSDGRCVLFSTVEHVTPDDTDASTDVFKHCGSTTTRETQGPGGGNGASESQVVGISSDGGRTLIQTNEHLTSDDTDDLPDLYERSNGATTRITPHDPEGVYGANYFGMSDDGTRVLFSRQDSLAATDTDTTHDLYLATLAPGASTRPATGVTHEAATLNGTASGDPAAKFHFEYGTSTAYGTSTPEQDVPAGAKLHKVSAAISGLSANTTYHYRLVVVGANGTTQTEDASFKTAEAPTPPDNGGGDGNGNGGGNNGGGDPNNGGNGGGDNQTPPPPPAADYAGIRIGGGTIKASKTGIVAIRISCPANAQGSCTGGLSLRAKIKGKLRRIGGKRVELAAGSKATVKLQLSSAARKQLRRTRVLRTTATAVTHDARGTNATTVKKLKLKR